MPQPKHTSLLIDTHCHLDFPDFDDDRDSVLQRAAEAGVHKMVAIATSLDGIPRVKALAEEHDNIWYSIGIHPCNVSDQSLNDLKGLKAHAVQPKVVGLGETGLDYFHDDSFVGEQQQSFRYHLQLAAELQKPVIVHTRDAEVDTLKLLREEYANAPFPGLIHCFTASQDFAEGVLELSMYISLSGIVTFKNAKDLQAVAKTIPLDRMLVETDAPYLAPMPHRGKRNEPAFTKHTAEFLADLRGEPFETLAIATTTNAERLFSM